MLTKDDKKEIRELVADSLADFFKNIFVPYLDREHEENKKDHEKIIDELHSHDKQIKSLQKSLDDNKTEHKVMFGKLEEITESVVGQGRRIRNLEASS